MSKVLVEFLISCTFIFLKFKLFFYQRQTLSSVGGRDFLLTAKFHHRQKQHDWFNELFFSRKNIIKIEKRGEE